MNSIPLGIMAENYILVAGKDGGATAAFANHLVRYLISAQQNFSTGLLQANEGDSRLILDRWRELWSEGRLPKGAGQPKDYAYRAQPLGQHKDKPPLDFAFREISGADLDSVLATEERPASLATELAALLGNPKLNFVLVLLCDRDEEAGALDQDASLASFVAHLKSTYGEEFTSRCPVLLIASEARGDRGNGQGAEAFTGESLPDTIAALQEWEGRYTLGELDIGELEYAGDGEPLLYSPKFDDAAKIFRWIYFQFTRYQVVEPFLKRLWKSVRMSAS